MGSANDPSNEGSIQNPTNVVLNGRFIEMAKEQAQQKVMLKRGQEGDKNGQFLIDMSTKEVQNSQQF